MSQSASQLLTPTTGSLQQSQYILIPLAQATSYANGLFSGVGGPPTPTLTNVASSIHSSFDAPSPQPSLLAGAGGAHNGYAVLRPVVPYGGLDSEIPNALGNDPIKASFIAAQSNPLIHLLAAPYIKDIRENNGEDLPTLDDLEDLFERSAFGLSGFADEIP